MPIILALLSVPIILEPTYSHEKIEDVERLEGPLLIRVSTDPLTMCCKSRASLCPITLLLAACMSGDLIEVMALINKHRNSINVRTLIEMIPDRYLLVRLWYDISDDDINEEADQAIPIHPSEDAAFKLVLKAFEKDMSVETIYAVFKRLRLVKPTLIPAFLKLFASRLVTDPHFKDFHLCPCNYETYLIRKYTNYYY